MTTTNTTPVTATSPASGTTPAPSNPGGEINKDEFLQLMIAQLQAQDPLQPTEGTAYVGELAQFTELEQMTNLAQSTEQATSANQVAQAVALIGQKVSYLDASGAQQEGTVQSVQITAAGATLTVGEVAGISPHSISEVA